MPEEEPKRLFKKLTPDNWLTADSTADGFVKMSGGVSSPMDDEQWTREILRPTLSDSIPKEIRTLFEVAQGVMCYGCFFYPLFTLGSEQTFRVLEAAVQERCEALPVPRGRQTFKGRLDWLHQHGHLSDERYRQWNATRELRNEACHPDRQSLFDPPLAVGNLRLAAELIEDLFAE